MGEQHDLWAVNTDDEYHEEEKLDDEGAALERDLRAPRRHAARGARDARRPAPRR